MTRTKKLVIAIVIAFVGAQAFASGPLGLDAFGIFGTFTGSTTGATGTGGLGLSLKWGQFPVLGVQYRFLQDTASIGLALDYYIIEAGLVDALDYYIAIGLYGGIAFSSTDAMFDFGIRVPIGLELWPLKKLEIYLGFVPMISLLPEPNLGFGGELGLRVHF